MKYLKKVQNLEEYNTFIVSSAFTIPNVTKIVNSGGGNYEVKYNPNEQGNYLWFFALGDGDISFTIPAKNPAENMPYISYSTDNGETWETEEHVYGEDTVVTVHLSTCQKVMFKGECLSGTNWTSASTQDSSEPSMFSSTMPVNVGGNIASLMYGDDFEGKTTLKLSATHAFFKLFQGMKIVHAKALSLPFTTLASNIYQRMFSTCTSMISAPSVLPAKTLASYAYYCMFENCSSLKSIPSSLPATTLKNYCYYGMFKDCSSLEACSYELTASTVEQCAYSKMFEGCTSLVQAPLLTATTMKRSGCTYMFASCSSLVTLPAMTLPSASGYSYSQMFSGCTSLLDTPQFTATINGNATYSYYGMFGGCVALTGCNVTFTNITLKSYCYASMFLGCKSLVTPPSLPSTSLATYCYEQMFAACTGLTNMPSLPANTLQNYCYRNMFSGCTSLTTVTGLNATTLGQYCYSHMFDSCTGITTVQSALPATTLQKYCYEYMFYKCTNLVTAPDLPALTLPDYSLQFMFNGCSKLNYIKAMFTTAPSNTKNKSWVTGVASSGTFVKNANATWTTTGANGVPTGWSVQTVTP